MIFGSLLSLDCLVIRIIYIKRSERTLPGASSVTCRVKTHTFSIDCSKLAHYLIVHANFSHHYFSKLVILVLVSIQWLKVWVLTQFEHVHTGPGFTLTAGQTAFIVSVCVQQIFDMVIELLLCKSE